MKSDTIKKITDCLYACLPIRYAEKLIMCANILVHDWQMSVPALRQDSSEDVSVNMLTDDYLESVFEDLDSESLLHIKRFCNFANHNPPVELQKRFFYNLQNIISNEERAERKRIKKALSRELKQLPYFPVEGEKRFDSNYECIYQHHGLRFQPQNVLNYIKGKDFLDIGACYGESALMFQIYSPGRIISFEPSSLNRRVYERTMTLNHLTENEVILLPYGVGDRREIVSFEDTGTGENTLGRGNGNQVQVYPLDTLDETYHFKTGVIKADVEGMGLEVVKGAETIIKRDRPFLTLSIYHNTRELLEIYPLIKSWDLHYRFSVRLLALPEEISELSLMAIPEELL